MSYKVVIGPLPKGRTDCFTGLVGTIEAYGWHPYDTGKTYVRFGRLGVSRIDNARVYPTNTKVLPGERIDED